MVVCAGIALSIGASHVLAVDPLEPYLNTIRLNELLAKGLDGSGINIGQIEFGSGNLAHVALAGADITNRAGATTRDHATGTASLMVGQRTAAGGNFQGVAMKASLWSSGLSTSSAATIPLIVKEVVDWQLTDPRTSVVNNSWGLDWNKGTEASRTSVRQIYDRAVTLGQLHVCAAGNEGQQTGTGANKTGNLTNPGYAYNTLTVGATGPLGTWNRVADFSSVTQADANGVPTARLKVDVVAPGVSINQAWGPANNSFSQHSGTSFATPITTGVVALLQQHGNAKGWSTDPRLMRAVLMNSANKSVENRAGVRWDQEFKANASGVAATRTSNESGAGQLDAMESYTQYNAGQGSATLKQGNATHQSLVKETGWDVDTVNGKGTANANDYLTKDQLRKGTYLTSTLVWNRDVDSSDADVTKWKYLDLAGMNLAIARSGSVATKVSLSNCGEKTGGGEDDALKGTTQHNVYKTEARDQYWISAYLRSTSPIANTTYALAWRGYSMTTNRVEAFNGGFDGDRGAYRDNGWFQANNVVTYGQCVHEAWMGGGNDNWAMRMTSALGISAGVAQEVVRPLTFFVVTFDIAFQAADFISRVDVFLGNLLMGSVFADGSNTQSFQFISDFGLDAAQLATLTPGAFVDLSFKFVSNNPNAAFIDNVAYVPSGSVLALLGVACVVSGSRRRR